MPRGVRFEQLPYAGDDVSGAVWDARAWDRSTRRRVRFELAPDVPMELAAEEG